MFAASHPQISVVHQEMLVAIAPHVFLLETKAGLELSDKAKGVDLSFVNLDDAANSSPSATTLAKLGS